MLEIGTIVNTHGLQGEVKIRYICDEELFEQIDTLYVDGSPFKLGSCRFHKGNLLATLKGIANIEQAMALKNRKVEVRRSELSLPEGHYFYSDIYGFAVYDRRVEKTVGTIKEVREAPAGMLYVIESGEQTFYIPAVDAFQRGVDFDARQVLVETIQGMLPDEN